MLQISLSPILDVMFDPQFPKLVQEYSAESALPIAPINPDVALYKQLEQTGMLTLAVRNDAELIGFAMLLPTRLPHYSTSVLCVESIFVAKDARNTGAGAKLLREIEHLARTKQYRGVLLSAPVGSVLSKIITRYKYKHTNCVYLQVF